MDGTLEQTDSQASPPSASAAPSIHPAVWALGLTSCLTDLSAEMVVSMLPIYLVLHLHMNPLEYGAIDGLYNGAAVALLSLAAGLIADRTRRHKEVAAAGYGLSALCKLLLLAGTGWGWIAGVIALDRAGKGARTSARDALISFHSSGKALAGSFALHRALDAAGSTAGPLIAFALLARLPDGYSAVLTTSFVFALLGVAVFCVFIRNPASGARARVRPVSIADAVNLLADRDFRAMAGAAAILSFATISDGFLYMSLQRNTRLAPGFFPLLYVITTAFYMLFSFPVGRLADSRGRATVLLAGYGALGLLDLVLFCSSDVGRAGAVACLVIFGLSSAATEGVLMAMASALIPPELRTSGLALMAAAAGIGTFLSSLMFGWLWQNEGLRTAIAASGLALAAALPIAAGCLKPIAPRIAEAESDPGSCPKSRMRLPRCRKCACPNPPVS
ncbi:MAG: MFS transporter [Elusimicrobiota bacterium]